MFKHTHAHRCPQVGPRALKGRGSSLATQNLPLGRRGSPRWCWKALALAAPGSLGMAQPGQPNTPCSSGPSSHDLSAPGPRLHSSSQTVLCWCPYASTWGHSSDSTVSNSRCPSQLAHTSLGHRQRPQKRKTCAECEQNNTECLGKEAISVSLILCAHLRPARAPEHLLWQQVGAVVQLHIHLQQMKSTGKRKPMLPALALRAAAKAGLDVVREAQGV